MINRTGRPIALGKRRHLAGLRPSELHPIYAGMVMGTGTLSSGAKLLGMPALSIVLGLAAAGAFVLLCVLGGLRLLQHPDLVRIDASGARTVFAPYTLVAALAVLGSRVALDGHVAFPAAALAVGVAGAAGLAFPSLAMVRRCSDRLRAVTGNWQLPSVAIEALALLAALLGGGTNSEACEALAVALWITGIAAYTVVVPLILRRFRDPRFRPSDFTPDYWTFMAVPSLIALVGSRLWLATPSLAAASWLRAVYRPAAFAGLLWSAALTLPWILLQVRRLVLEPASRRYSPPWWGLVFPTAIVAVAAQVAGATFHVGWLHRVALAGYWCVLAVWATVALGMARSMVRIEPSEIEPSENEAG
jgi:tellurite resistance protein TehA-like permease